MHQCLTYYEEVKARPLCFELSGHYLSLADNDVTNLPLPNANIAPESIQALCSSSQRYEDLP